MKPVALLHMLFGLWILTLSGISTAAPQTIKVGAYTFPPYFENSTGVIPRFLTLINQSQDRYRFVLIKTSARRRYIELEKGVFDMMLFENPKWGWDLNRIQAGKPLLSEAELYIARSAPKRDQAFFHSLEQHTIVAIFGFHYGFPGFKSEASWLGKNPRIHFVTKPALVLEKVLSGEDELGIITASYLKQLQKTDSRRASRLLVGTQKDCEYLLGPLFGPHSPLSPAAFDLQIAQMEGKWKNFAAEEGLSPTE